MEPTTSGEFEESKTEAILYDILDQVFSHLNVRDLCRAARVSKSWRDTAKRELSKRGPEAVVLQYVYPREDEFDSEDEDERLDHENATHVSNSLRIKPEVSIFFTDNTSLEYEEPWYQIQSRFSYEFLQQSYVTVIQTLTVTVDETEVTGFNDLTAGLFLPLSQTVNVEVVCPEMREIERYHANNEFTQDIVDKLFPNKQEHTCVIMFHGCGWEDDRDFEIYISKFHSQILSDMKSRLSKLGNASLWGGGVASITMNGYYEEDYPTTWIGVSISGPTLRSWSVVVDCNLPNSLVEEKLLTLKKDVDLRYESVALMFLPSNDDAFSEEKRSRITSFKKVFPTVRLLSVFNDRKYPAFSVDTTTGKHDQEISHTNSVAYLILSYR